MRPFSARVPAAQPNSTVQRRVEVTFEREVVSITRLPSTRGTGWCERCRREVTLLPIDEAAATGGMTPRQIYRYLEQDRLHFEESRAGAIRVCSESLRELIVLEAGPTFDNSVGNEAT